MLCMKAVSLLGYFAMVGGLLALLFTGCLLSSSPFVIGAQIAAVLLVIWARIAFGMRSFHLAANPTEGGLVTTGPYRFIRHPIYTAICILVTAGAVAHASLITWLTCALVWSGSFVRMWCEEKLVAQRYPEYEHYAAKTARMIPYVF